jgi:hypothetical protein
LIAFRNELCTALTPAFVNAATGLELHRFLWAGDAIGALPLEWNHLCGEYPANPDAKGLHFTNGGVWHGAPYDTGIEADLWRKERDAMLGVAAAVPA